MKVLVSSSTPNSPESSTTERTRVFAMACQDLALSPLQYTSYCVPHSHPLLSHGPPGCSINIVKHIPASGLASLLCQECPQKASVPPRSHPMTQRIEAVGTPSHSDLCSNVTKSEGFSVIALLKIATFIPCIPSLSSLTLPYLFLLIYSFWCLLSIFPTRI